MRNQNLDAQTEVRRMIPVAEVVTMRELPETLANIKPRSLLCIGVDMTSRAQHDVQIVYIDEEDEVTVRTGVIVLDFDPTRFAYMGYAGHAVLAGEKFSSLVEHDGRLASDLSGAMSEVMLQYLRCHLDYGFADVVLVRPQHQCSSFTVLRHSERGTTMRLESVEKCRLAPDGTFLGVSSGNHLVALAPAAETFSSKYTLPREIRLLDRIRVSEENRHATIVASVAGELCSNFSIKTINDGLRVNLVLMEEWQLDTRGNGVFGGVVSEPHGHYFTIISYVNGIPRISFAPREFSGRLPRTVI